MTGTAPAHQAACPRCGYDQRGVTARWTESCDLFSTCSECGLRIDWGNVLSDKRRRPRWCVEYSPKWWHVPKRTVTTLAMICWPWGFWKSLKMHHEVRWGRIAAFASCLLAGMYLMLVVVTTWDSYRNWRDVDTSIMNNIQNPRPGWTFQMISRTPWYAVVFRPVLNPLSPTRAAPTTYRATSSQGTWVLSGSLHSPRELVVQRTKGFVPLFRLDPLHRIVAFPFLIYGIIPIGFILLPQTRRQYHIRWCHILRITVYAALFMFAFILMAGLLMPSRRIRMSFLNPPDAAINAIAIFAFLIVPTVLSVWWGAAIRRYLKLPHAWAISLALTLIAAMSLLAAGYFWLILDYWIEPWYRFTEWLRG